MTSAPDTPTRPSSAYASRAAGVVVLAALAVYTLTRTSTAPEGPLFEWSGSTMGTTYDIKIDADVIGAEAEAVTAEVSRVLERIDDLMSTYDSTSQVSRFNRHATSDPFPISPEMIEVLRLAQDVTDRSDGLFDVTVGPAVDAWGFGPHRPGPTPPSDSALAAVREKIGSGGFTIDPDARTLTKLRAETRLDLSAIAKGYAVDLIAQALEERGLTRFLVEIGGELRAGAPKRNGQSWSVGIEKPDPDGRTLFAVIEVDSAAIATSGDYRNLVTDGVHSRTHLIDPRTGSSLPFQGASVSVVHAEAAAADAWATALSVAGFERGYELAVREQVAALFLRASDDEGVEARATPVFIERIGVLREVGR